MGAYIEQSLNSHGILSRLNEHISTHRSRICMFLKTYHLRGIVCPSGVVSILLDY